MSVSRRRFLTTSATGMGLAALGRSALGQAPGRSLRQRDAGGAGKPDSGGRNDRDSDAVANPFLSDNFAPVREEVTAESLKIHGRLPDDLNGLYVRNGPNPQFDPLAGYHWFDGDGMLHGVQLRDGKASYRNRWVRTQSWLEENRAGKTLFPSLLDKPDVEWIGRRILAGKLPFPNRANTALIWHHGKLLALWEGGAPYEIRVPGLETVGGYDFKRSLKHSFTAHPKVDPRTGELVFFGFTPLGLRLQHSVADRSGKIVHTTAIDLPRPVMMHDAAITERHTVFLDTPAVFDFNRAALGKSVLQWQPQHGARIGVIGRRAAGDTIRWFRIKTCFVFHVYNAYEQGDEVVLLGCRFRQYPQFVDLKKLAAKDFARVMDQAVAVTYQWRCNLRTRAVVEGPLDDQVTEFPRVDERRTGAATRYGYALTGSSKGGSLLKYDFQKRTSVRHTHSEPEWRAGEGVFVPRQDARDEDDGYVLSYMYHDADVRSELWVVDARDFKRPPLARIALPQRVPYGFHGLWVPAAS